MHAFQINTLIQFFTFSGLMHVSNLMGSSSGRQKCVFEHNLPPARLLTPMHGNMPYKNCVYNCLPEDEPVRFETYRRRQKLKNSIKVLI